MPVGDDSVPGSTNAALFFERFMSHDGHWITHINGVLEEKKSKTEEH